MDGLLTGTKRLIADAEAADVIIVSVEMDGTPALCLVERSSVPAGSMRRERIIDETKRSFEIAQGVGAQCATFCQDHGLIPRAILDSIALCPPMIIQEDEVNAMIDRLEKGLDETEAWVSKEGLRQAA